MQILPAGDRALLVELDGLDEVLGYYTALLADPAPHAVDVVPAARTVLVTTAGSLDELRRHLMSVQPLTTAQSAGDLLEVPVIYDGADLADVASLLGCSPADVVERHTSEQWTVAFCGFAPGFGYLTGTADWNIPRRSSPRTKVPVGAVGLAGEFSGVYPRESPGGWQLIGRTDLQIFDQQRDPAALFHPGRRVRFIEAS
ncbi:allophanate hydrolase subunit 1 [Kribbella antibiotica]|uniref:Allophanate hydrolase subunit 1 n=1 Tax=Kribbella antibiotica TaxID=190195 RepID=A0A4V2YLT4_9ACTN|nr:allophanate hydrolase subunit 1 [Kribbella antibiotica]TDD46997.1 allophanate hydrolase subunit 1 [Kribbella antibiotica]